MILYFTGTGNSRYVSEVIQSIVKDELVSINELIKRQNNEELNSDKPFIFVMPTYAWKIPRVVEDFIRKSRFSGSNKVYFVLTCDSQIGDAISYVKKICEDKNFEFYGLTSVNMPENYIAMYNIKSREDSEEKIERALPKILDIADAIQNGKVLIDDKTMKSGKVMSAIVNPIFYKFFVSAKGFFSTDKCIGCGKCVELCPLNNVQLINKKIQWGSACTHCMACICGCPKNAIEFKNKTKGKNRYYNKGYNL